MKFRLKIGHLYGSLVPDSNNGRTYGMYMIPWIKTVKEALGLGLKEAKSLADYLRADIELGNRDFSGAYVDVDVSQFPFLERHTDMPKTTCQFIEVIDRDEDVHHATCIDVTGMFPNPTSIIKDAMRKLIDINAWEEVRRLAEVLMDIEDAIPSGPFASAQ